MISLEEKLYCIGSIARSHTMACSKRGLFSKNQLIVSRTGVCSSIDLSLVNCPTGVSTICKYPFSDNKFGQLLSSFDTSISAS